MKLRVLVLVLVIFSSRILLASPNATVRSGPMVGYGEMTDLMIWLGDNCYYREPDWTSEAHMRYCYAHTRSVPDSIRCSILSITLRVLH